MRRRQVVGGADALAVAALSVSAVPVIGADAALIAAWSELQALAADRAAREAELEGASGDHTAWAAYDTWDKQAWKREDDLVETIIALPALTSTGLRAKAAATVMWLNRMVPVFKTDTFEDSADAHDALAMSLAKDLMAIAG